MSRSEYATLPCAPGSTGCTIAANDTIRVYLDGEDPGIFTTKGVKILGLEENLPYDANIYDNPASFGLEIVAELGDGGGYDWSLGAIWKTRDGKLFGGTDAGCSCNSAFEGCTDVNDMSRVTTMQDIRAIADGVSQDYIGNGERIEFIRRAWRELGRVR